MQEVIRPQGETVPVSKAPIEKETLEAATGLRNVEFANYLGEDRFDEGVMEKIEVLVEHYQDVEKLMEADVHLGKNMDMTKLDKLYSYALLSRQEAELEIKQDLIRRAKEDYEQSNRSIRLREV